MSENNEGLITLTTDIVAAHVANNYVAVNDLPRLIANVHQALLGLTAQPEASDEVPKRQPAVSVRMSVKPDVLTCLVCGSKQKTMKRHLRVAHGLTPSAYRMEFDLRPDYPMIAEEYAQQRRALAHKIGLGHMRGPKK